MSYLAEIRRKVTPETCPIIDNVIDGFEDIRSNLVTELEGFTRQMAYQMEKEKKNALDLLEQIREANGKLRTALAEEYEHHDKLDEEISQLQDENETLWKRIKELEEELESFRISPPNPPADNQNLDNNV